MPRVGQLIVKSGRVVGLVAMAGSLTVSTATPAWADEPAPNCTAADLAAEQIVKRTDFVRAGTGLVVGKREVEFLTQVKIPKTHQPRQIAVVMHEI